MLKYPQEIGSGQDFIVFSHEPYRTNQEIIGQDPSVAPAGPPADAENGQIILYMPNSTPPVTNQQSWSQQNFEGPFGQIVRNIGIGLAGGASALGTSDMSVDNAIEGFNQQISGIKEKGGPAAKQFILGKIAETFGMSGAGALTALQRGEVYNPNVELLYQSPQLRGFSLDFVFIPKSKTEADIMNQIILAFKTWSAPEVNGTMLKLPHLWRVRYKSQTGNNGFMNQFKKCALTTIQVQHNPGTDMHATFSDGTPLVTAMSLGFQEVDIIHRDDHIEVGGQGY